MEKPCDKPALTGQPIPFGKPLYREKMRNLPLPEKVRIVVELQKIAAPILRARGETPFVWQIEDESATERK